MAELTLSEIVAITRGKANLIENLEVKPTGFCFDSRDVKPGEIFAAFVGEQADGHDYVEAALASGAICALVSKPVSAPSILVTDVLKSITELAKKNREKLNIPVLALTGSSGKTTTKDLLIDLLQPLGNVVATTGSRNNELGLPITLLAANNQTAAIILEMGARHRGNIKELCEIAKPNIVGITNIGSAHLGEFGSTETIMHTKGEIVELLEPTGIAVLNADQIESRVIASKTKGRIQYAGMNSTANIRVTNLELDEFARSKFDLVTPVGSVNIKLQLIGEHQANNVAIAAGMALAAGISIYDIKIALESAVPRSGMRLSRQEINGISIIDDSYNANPESVIAAIASLAKMACSGRRIGVLGEMAELGEAAVDLHQKVGQAAADLDLLIAVGQLGREIFNGALGKGMPSTSAIWAETKDTALESLRHEMRPGDIVLIKASRAARFDLLANAIREMAGE